LDCLRQLTPDGPEGFEGLVRLLLEAWTGRRFRLARGGAQFGHDSMTDPGPLAPVILAECKRYAEDNKPPSRDLMGEFGQALSRYPELDLWVLVATTEIPSTGLDEIWGLAEKHAAEVLVIDTRPTGGELELLCAGGPDLTIQFLSQYGTVQTDRKLLQAYFSTYRAQSDFGQSERSFRAKIAGLQLGYEDARQAMAKWLRDQVADHDAAHSAFGQDLALRGADITLIPRPSISTALDQWWDLGATQPFSLLGEEGSGKSWAAFSWVLELLRRPGFSIVIPLVSKSAHDWARQPPATIISMLLLVCVPNSTYRSPVWWEKRVKRWLAHMGKQDRPLFLFLLDGLNESPDAPWRQYLADLQGPDFVGRIGALLTCRKPFWDEHLGRGTRLPAPFITEGYDEAELHQAVAGRVELSKVPPDLRDLMRRPRYCDLVVQHCAAMISSGDLTIARLIFEDRRDRHRRKLEHPFSPEEFDQVLRGLANAHHHEWKCGHGHAVFGKRELRGLLPSDDPRALQEIIDGGVLDPTGDPAFPYRVEKQRLIYGLGMLLASELGRQADDFADAIQEWFEPQRDMDIKTEILGAAVFFSLPNQHPTYPALQRRALIRAWLISRNMPPEQEAAIAAYLPDCAEDMLAESDGFFTPSDDPIGNAQVRFGKALAVRRQDQRVLPHLIIAAERWAGYVQDSDDGSTLEAQSGGFQKVPFGDPRGTALQIFLGAMLQAGPREPFVTAYGRAALSAGFIQGRFIDQRMNWSLRLTDEDLEAWALSSFGDLAVHGGAGHVLLRIAIGTRQCRDHPEVRELMPRLQDDEDGPTRDLAIRILNPAAKFQVEMPTAVREQLAKLPLDDYFPSRHQTSTSFEFRKLEPMAARLAPKALAEFWRSLLRSLPNRQDDNLLCLGLSVPEMMMVATDEEFAAVAAIRSRMEANDRSDAKTAEALLSIAWAMGPATIEIIERFVARPDDAYVLRQLHHCFQPQPDEVAAHVHARLLSEREPKRLARWFLVAACSPRPLTEAERTVIARCLDHDDSDVRFYAALNALRLKDAELFALVGISARTLIGDDGNLADRLLAQMLIRHGQHLPFEAIAVRLPLPDLSAAVAARGLVACEIASLAKSIGLAVRLVWSDAAIPNAATEIRGVAETCELGGVPVYSFDELEAKPQRIEMNSPEAFERFKQIFGGGDEWDGKAAAEAEGRRLRSLLAAGRQLNEGAFSPQALMAIYTQQPQTVMAWVEAALCDTVAAKRFRLSASAFLQSLAYVLIQMSPELGFRLWAQLHDEGVSLTINMVGAATDWMTCLPFQAPDSPKAFAARKHLLDQALADRDFLELANASAASGRLDWLREFISDHISQKPLWRRAKGLTLAALCDFEDAEFDDLVARADVEDSWVGDALPAIRRYHNQNLWARYWCRQFLTAPDRDTGLAGFVLFLKCADRRCRLWMEALEQEAMGAVGFDEWRIRYRRIVDDTVVKAIKANETPLADTLFGLPFKKDEVIPYGLWLAPDIQIPAQRGG
jgi:hypothetical protein